MTNTIELIAKELPKYNGLTKSEKDFGLIHLEEWIPENGHLNTLIDKFSEKSLDITPFLEKIGLQK
jgi:hypothetical protein